MSDHTDVWILSEFKNPPDENHLPEIVKHLQSLFPGFPIREKEQAQEGTASEYFVVYEKEDIRQKMLSDVHPLLFHLNPESTGFSDAYSLFQSSRKAFSDIMQTRKV